MKNLKRSSSLVILLLVNFIFAYKYIHRITDFSLQISLSLILVQFLFYKFENRIVLSTKWITVFFYSAIILLLGVVFFTWLKIPLAGLNIDRYSIITSFIDAMLKGNYPYFAKSIQGNYPGPMPTYFLIALPFYLIGELSILSFIGYGLYLFYISKRIKDFTHIKFFLFYFLSSIFVYWEIASRSNIFTFSVLILFLMDYFLRVPQNNKLKIIVFSLLAGLLLSTRSVYIIVYIVFFISGLINKEYKFKHLFFIGLIALFGFILTFLPLLIFFKNDFFVMNPFTIQSSFLVPQIYVLAFIIITILITFSVKNNADKFFISGISLFFSILIYACYSVYKCLSAGPFYENCVDISYFIFCVPFFTFFLTSSESNDYLKTIVSR